jgi:CBS domain-containing protein
VDAKTVLEAKGASVISVTPNVSVSEAVKILHDEKIGVVLVIEEERDQIVGILSERDVVRVVAERGSKGLEGTVADAMTRDVVVCTSDSTMQVIISGMSQFNVRHLPVLEDGRLLGLISVRDVMQRRIEQLERGEEHRFQRWFPKGRIYSLRE